MADNAIQVSVKLHDGTIFVVGGPDVPQFLANLEALTDPETSEAIVQNMAEKLTPVSLDQAAANVAVAFSGSPVSGPAGQVGAKACQHGAMTHRNGVSAKGAWSGWFCPLPRGTVGQCKPQYDN